MIREFEKRRRSGEETYLRGGREMGMRRKVMTINRNGDPRSDKSNI